MLYMLYVSAMGKRRDMDKRNRYDVSYEILEET